MRNLAFFHIFISLALVVTACDNYGNERGEIGKTAEDFATAYFNYDFTGASQFATDDCRKWFEFEASNISDENIRQLREMEEGATVELDGIEIVNDSTASVGLRIRNFLAIDSIGGLGHIVDEKTIVLQLQRTREAEWKVRMEGPLQSGK
ncbi:MAG: hypothetical protein ACI3Y0_11020 [Prevotella sp.]